MPPSLRIVLALGLALKVGACGSNDSDLPDDGLSADAAAINVAVDAGSAATDAGGSSPQTSSNDAGTVGRDSGTRSDAGSEPNDAGEPVKDGGSSDAGSRDDAGTSDAGARDAGSADAASQDSGTRDAGGGNLKTTVVEETITVKAGQTFDGSGKRFVAGKGVGDGSQSEGQKPVFKLEDGATLRNVVIGAPAADGVHTHGDATLENIVWEDIGEDAMTIKESGTVVLNGGSASNGEDKVFQINAASTFRVSNFKASRAGKFIRQNGGTTFKVAVFIDRCDISYMDEAVFRTDSNVSTVSMTNSRTSNIGDMLFIGVTAGNITQSGNTTY